MGTYQETYQKYKTDLSTHAEFLAEAYAAAYKIIAKEVGADPNNAQMSNAHFAALKAMELAAR